MRAKVFQCVRPRRALNSFMTVVPYHIKTSPLIGRANQWTGLYMIGISVTNELKKCFVEVYLRLCQTSMMKFFHENSFGSQLTKF